jgi:protein translocase SecG subunit
MELFYQILLVITVILGAALGVLVFVTGKGDGMSAGGGAVRTTFKGKASFDDQMSRILLFMTLGFMGLCIVLDTLAHRLN